MKKEWRMLKEEVGFSGFFTLFKYTLQHELFKGGWSQPIQREVLHRGHAAAVIPYDASIDSTLLVEQFRSGAIHAERPPWLLEFVAGMVEEGESAEEVVRREAKEEAGIDIHELHHLTTYYPSPGGSTETIALYWAPTDLTCAGGVFGLVDEGEDIRASVIEFDKVLSLVRNGQINNSLSIIAVLWFESIRQKIQATTVDV